MKPILFAIPVFFLLIALELWVARSRGLTIYRLKDSLTSINIGLISEFTKAIGGVISVAMFLLMNPSTSEPLRRATMKFNEEVDGEASKARKLALMV